MIGCGRVANRFPLEAGVVNGITITACFDTNADAMNDYARTFEGVKASRVRVRGTGTLVHNIELLCHGKLERYQPLTFITSYFVA